MMTRRNLLKSLLIAPPAAAALTAAAGVSGCSRRPRDDNDGRVTIRYMAWGNPEQLAVEKQIAAEFEKRNPNVRVHLFMVPGSAYADKLQLMLASRTAPDVMRADHYYFPALARKEYFMPLEPFIAKEKPGFLEDFVPIAVEEGKWKDTLYGMNVLFGGVQIYYNKNLFEGAGLTDPYTLSRQGKWDWPTFVSAAQALTKRAGDRAVQFGANMVGFPLYASVVWNHGGDFMNADMTRMTLGEDENAIRGLEEYANLRWKYRCAPTPADSALSAFTFESGKIAMHWGWSGESPRFRKNIKSFEWDLAPTPSGPEGNASVVKGNQLCIYKETRYPDEAWEFLKFMTGPEAEMLLGGELRRSVPTRLSVQKNPQYLTAELPPFHTDIFLEAVERGRTLPIDWRYQEWSQVYNSATETLFNVNVESARQAAQEAARRVNAILGGEEGF